MTVEQDRQLDDEGVPMATLLAPPQRSIRPTRRERRAEKRRLTRLDALSAQLAELPRIAALLERAAEVVGTGWVQGAWFAVEVPGGRRAVTAYDISLADDLP